MLKKLLKVIGSLAQNVMVATFFMAGMTVFNAAFGLGTGPIFLDYVECAGTESSLLNCTCREVHYKSEYNMYHSNCLDYNDVGVVCPSCKSCSVTNSSCHT